MGDACSPTPPGGGTGGTGSSGTGDNPGTGRGTGSGGCQATGTADGSRLVLLAIGLVAARRARRPLVTRLPAAAR